MTASRTRSTGLRARGRSLLQSEVVQRRAARVMLFAACLGLLLAAVGTFVAWQLVGDVNDATADTLDVTVESLQSLDDALVLTEDLLGSTSESLTAVETNLEAVSGTLESGTDVIGDVGDLASTTGPALDDVSTTLRQLEVIGAQVDGALSGLSALPLGPDYDAENGLGTTFGRVADDLEPLPAQFAETSESLTEFEGSLAELEVELVTLTETVGGVNDDLAESEQLIDDYRTTVSRARDVAERSRDDLEQDETALRIIIVLAGLNFAATQIVPFWLGWQILDSLDEDDDDHEEVSALD